MPPFYPGFVLFAGPPKPEDYAHRRAGIYAHNRWLVDFCARKPAQRAGIGQIFLNDIDDAIEDATWIKEHGLRGGVLLPTVAPDVTWVKPLYHPDYDRLWAALQDLDVPVNLHGGTGSPNYGKFPSTPMIMIAEVPFYGIRPFVHMLLSGVFERFPRLRFVITEASAAAFPPLLKQLDGVVANVRKGEIGELKYTSDNALPRSATEYFQQSCWVGASFPGPADWAAHTALGPDRFMWGNDYPHDEGSGPYSKEALRAVFHDVPQSQLRDVLAGNVAKLYDFDLDALAPLAEQYGPTVDGSRPRSPSCPTSPMLRCSAPPRKPACNARRHHRGCTQVAPRRCVRVRSAEGDVAATTGASAFVEISPRVPVGAPSPGGGEGDAGLRAQPSLMRPMLNRSVRPKISKTRCDPGARLTIVIVRPFDSRIERASTRARTPLESMKVRCSQSTTRFASLALIARWRDARTLLADARSTSARMKVRHCTSGAPLGGLSGEANDPGRSNRDRPTRNRRRSHEGASSRVWGSISVVRTIQRATACRRSRCAFAVCGVFAARVEMSGAGMVPFSRELWSVCVCDPATEAVGEVSGTR